MTCLHLGRNVAEYRIAAGADFQQAVRVATVLEHARAAYCELLKVILLANRETYQTLRAYVREWTLAQRTCDDLGRHMAHDTLAPMDIGQVEAAKGRCNKGKNGEGKEKGKSKKGNGEAKDMRGHMILTVLAIVGTVANAQSWKQKKDQGSKPPAATVSQIDRTRQMMIHSGLRESWLTAVQMNMFARRTSNQLLH